MIHDTEGHRIDLEKLISNPAILGIQRPIVAAMEAYVRDEDGNLLCQPDGLIWNAAGKLYIVEYKQSTRHRQRAIEQLYTARQHVGEYFKMSPTLLYVHDKNKIERIT
jgi:hypothetical protein